MSLPPLRQVVTADTSQFEGAMGRLPGIAARVAAGVAAGITAATAGLVALTKASLANVDATTKQARSLGLTTRAFQAMTLVANEAGVSNDRLAASLGLMQRQIIELGDGTQTAVDAFSRLGLSIEDLAGLSPDEQFARIAEALNTIADPATRTATAMDIFGRSGRDVINMLGDYNAKLDDARTFQEQFGIAVNQIDAEQIERANDAVGRIREAFSGLGNILAARFAPAIERAARSLTQIIGVFTRVIQTTDTNKEAQEELNRALGVYASTGAPNAKAEAEALASAQLDSAQAALAEARAQLKLADARMTAQGALDPEFAAIVGAEGDAAQRNVNSALADIERLEAVLVGLRRGPIDIGGNNVTTGTGLNPNDPNLLPPKPEPVPGVGGGTAVANQMAERLAALQEGLATEDEVIAEWYADGLQTLNDALASRKLTEEEYMALRERLEQEHQNRLNAIRSAGENVGLESTKSVLGSMLQAVQSGGDKMIGAQKAISAALAAINVYEGITKALTLPFPQNFVVAAQTAAQGFAAISKIQSIGRGATGTGGGGAAAISGAGSAPALPRQNIVIDLVGDTFSRGSVQEVFDVINDGLRRGYQIEGVLVR